jgi:alkanesulfonate monooxygenase SsuD/methylene tetrahydromethanopterin reductase-like flavin-dependent oxidoreductase (luciferase family)
MLGADLANCTERLRAGQCGVIIPDWNPIRVAEDIALLDQFTKGRAEFGVARGLESRAAIQFNQNANRKDSDRNRALFEESMEVILGIWTEEAFKHSGEFYTYPVPGWKETNPMVYDPRYHTDDMELIALGLQPKPYQKPHPPVWMMAESKQSHEYIGKKGLGAMCSASSLGIMKETWAAHNAAMSEFQGREVPFGEKLAVMRPTFVADTYEEAVNAVRDGANLLGSWISGKASYLARKSMVSEEEFSEGDMDLSYFDFQMKHELILVGSPDSVAESIERLRSEVNCEHFALFLNFPGLSFKQVMRNLELFGDKVMPQFPNQSD